MNTKTLLKNFEIFAEAPGGVDRLRELILDLAVRGDLGPTDTPAVKAPISWDFKEQKLDADKLWKLDTMHLNPANGWSRLPLARLGSWGSGGTPTASRKEFYNNGSIPWAVIGDLNNGIMTETSSKITQKALASSSAKLIPKNAVLIAMYGASIGKTAVTGIDCTTNQAIAHCIVDESVVSTEYFFLVAKSLKKHLVKVGKGAAQPNISQAVLKHLLIDVPHLDAQRIVVTKVDELMALCDQLEQQQDNRDNLAKKFSRSIVSID
jgi:type I restriction enzyme S subunit